MMVVAKKKEGLLLAYGVMFFVGLLMIGIGFARFEVVNVLLMIMGAITCVLACRIVFKYVRTPEEIITVDNKGILHLPKDIVLDPKDIIDVSYRRARGKSITYDWGEVIIITHIESFKFDYVDDCEEVSKELTRMMYESKQAK